jgi:Purple acid Phosphatase, N-terminal domain/Calcineurin-like phosphoesterase
MFECLIMPFLLLQQIHLSLTGKTGEMGVDFVSYVDASNVVAYGTSPTSLTSTAQAHAVKFSQVNNTVNWVAYVNWAVMTNLLPDTKYWYTVGSKAAGWSAVYSFVNDPAPHYDNGAIRAVVVYADFGLGNAESLLALYSDAYTNGFDYVIHAGDMAYDLDSGDFSEVGNGFMNSIQPYAAIKPYQPICGNHEAYGSQGASLFLQYRHRFLGVQENAGVNSGSNTNLWYSFDDLRAGVHYVAFTSETWTMTPTQITDQLAWLTNDLQKANANRAVTPWIIAYSHKIFNMDQVDWVSSGLASALHYGGVDVIFAGHWHQYVSKNFVRNSTTSNLLTFPPFLPFL